MTGIRIAIDACRDNAIQVFRLERGLTVVAREVEKLADDPVHLFDIGDHAMKHNQPERLLVVATEGERVAPSDSRSEFYRAVAWVMKSERPEDSERMLRDYLKRAPLRNTFPAPWRAHEWLGRLYENQQKTQAAIQEYETALKLEPKDKTAREALKRLRKDAAS